MSAPGIGSEEPGSRDAFAMPQTWDPARYAANARFVAELGLPVLELLAPAPGERILDLGCGDGYLGARLKEMGCDVLGVDASAAQVEAARVSGPSVPGRLTPGSRPALESPPHERKFTCHGHERHPHYAHRPGEIPQAPGRPQDYLP